MAPKTEIPVATNRKTTVESSQVLAADRLLTINEVAELTGLAVGSLYHFVSEKRIPVVRLSSRCIRFRYSDLLSWIEKLTQQPRQQ